MPTPRILLLLSQMPQDPASGAARSMKTICEFLAAAGMEVMAVATTATEAAGELDAWEFLRAAAGGIRIDSAGGAGAHREGEAFRFDSRGVRYVLLHTGGHSLDAWEEKLGARFDSLFAETLRTFRPDILFTFGGRDTEAGRRRQARHAGSKVVFGLRNLSYLTARDFQDVDAILTGSQFVTRRYRATLGIQSTPLPLPLDGADIVAARHEKVFVTYINPSIEKGVFFAARLFEELSIRRPDIPILIVESRGTSGHLVSAGLATEGDNSGFDLRRHENLMVTGRVARPADIFSLARTIVMPSVWEEPAGRVAAEALANGIPPLVSDRGGLPEICAGGGFVLPVGPDAIARPRSPVPARAVAPWIELLARLVDDEPFYAEACRRAAAAGLAYDAQRLIPRYAEFFRAVLESRVPPPG